MSPKQLPALVAVLLLKATSSLAQSQPAPAPRPAPDPDYQEVSVSVPRAVTLVADVAKTFFSRDDTGKSKVQELVDRRRARSAKREQSLTITVPKNGLTRTLGLVD